MVIYLSRKKTFLIYKSNTYSLRLYIHVMRRSIIPNPGERRGEGKGGGGGRGELRYENDGYACLTFQGQNL